MVKIRFGIGAGAFESGRQAVLGIEIVFVFDFAGIAVQSIGSRLFESRPQNLFLRTVQEIAVENGIVPVVPQIVQVDGQPIVFGYFPSVVQVDGISRHGSIRSVVGIIDRVDGGRIQFSIIDIR